MARCCSNFTRTELLRRGVAEAGRGLPAIEPGMPVPAGSGLDRRHFLARGLGLALAVYGGAALRPEAWLAGIEAAAAAGPQRVLVSVFLDGGADSLSMLFPPATRCTRSCVRVWRWRRMPACRSRRIRGCAGIPRSAASRSCTARAR
jgi:hypothetical protein